MVQEIAFKNGTISNFQGLFDLDRDLGSGHTANHRASLIDLYQISFKSKELRVHVHTDVCMYAWMVGRIFETHIIRSTQKN